MMSSEDRDRLERIKWHWRYPDTANHAPEPDVVFLLRLLASCVGVRLVDIARRQRAFSERALGPAPRTAGILAHIRKELVEIEADPADVSEWADLVILALDGAWRAGHSPEAIAAAVPAKMAINEGRTWPDWRTADPNLPIEHKR